MNISVIIPTTANSVRAPFLMAALNSIFSQSEHRAVPIVVVNGPNYVPDLLATLRSDTRLRVLYREQPGEMGAVVAGRRAVDSAYFGILDDDDIYLPNAFATDIASLNAAPEADAVVTNGFRRTEAGTSLFLDDFSKISSDPLLMMMRQNWLTSAGALFRTDAVGEEFFAEAPTMLEYTYIGLRLALTRKLRFTDTPTFIKQDLLADAITRSSAYVTLQPRALEHIMTLTLPPKVKYHLKRKLAASRHHVSTLELSERRLRPAWRAHLESMGSLYGLRYLPFTRHLVRAAISSQPTATMFVTAIMGNADLIPIGW
jgi:hypothetical protein